jgi:hypothetical protein
VTFEAAFWNVVIHVLFSLAISSSVAAAASARSASRSTSCGAKITSWIALPSSPSPSTALETFSPSKDSPLSTDSSREGERRGEGTSGGGGSWNEPPIVCAIAAPRGWSMAGAVPDPPPASSIASPLGWRAESASPATWPGRSSRGATVRGTSGPPPPPVAPADVSRPTSIGPPSVSGIECCWAQCSKVAGPYPPPCCSYGLDPPDSLSVLCTTLFDLPVASTNSASFHTREVRTKRKEIDT